MTVKELIKNLPENWNEITLKQYIKISKLNMLEVKDEFDLTNHLDNILSIITCLFNLDKDFIDSITYEEMQQIANKLSYFNEAPQQTKSNLRIRKLEKISYNSFVSYQQLARKENIVDNYPTILKEFIKDKLTIEEIENLSITDCMYLFNDLKKKLKLFLVLSQIKIILKIIKLNWKKQILNIAFKLKFWKKRKI